MRPAVSGLRRVSTMPRLSAGGGGAPVPPPRVAHGARPTQVGGSPPFHAPPQHRRAYRPANGAPRGRPRRTTVAGPGSRARRQLPHRVEDLRRGLPPTGCPTDRETAPSCGATTSAASSASPPRVPCAPPTSKPRRPPRASGARSPQRRRRGSPGQTTCRSPVASAPGTRCCASSRSPSTCRAAGPTSPTRSPPPNCRPTSSCTSGRPTSSCWGPGLAEHGLGPPPGLPGARRQLLHDGRGGRPRRPGRCSSDPPEPHGRGDGVGHRPDAVPGGPLPGMSRPDPLEALYRAAWAPVVALTAQGFRSVGAAAARRCSSPLPPARPWRWASATGRSTSRWRRPAAPSCG